MLPSGDTKCTGPTLWVRAAINWIPIQPIRFQLVITRRSRDTTNYACATNTMHVYIFKYSRDRHYCISACLLLHHCSILLCSSGCGTSMSSVSGCRLNGSIFEFSKCLTITERSTIIPLGKRTGSFITESMIGSEWKIIMSMFQRVYIQHASTKLVAEYYVGLLKVLISESVHCVQASMELGPEMCPY